MSAFDWVQILLGIRYCLRRAIGATALLFRSKIKGGLAPSETGADSPNKASGQLAKVVPLQPLQAKEANIPK